MNLVLNWDGPLLKSESHQMECFICPWIYSTCQTEKQAADNIWKLLSKKPKTLKLIARNKIQNGPIKFGNDQLCSSSGAPSFKSCICWSITSHLARQDRPDFKDSFQWMQPSCPKCDRLHQIDLSWPSISQNALRRGLFFRKRQRAGQAATSSQWDVGWGSWTSSVG